MVVLDPQRGQVQGIDDDAEQVVEVMGDAQGELADRFHALGGDHCLLRVFEVALGFVAFGDVAGDLGKADELAVVVDRVDHHAGPETRAVLAPAPAFAGEAAFGAGNGEVALGQARVDVVVGIEHPVVMPDHFEAL